jgi:hypothetical protein
VASGGQQLWSQDSAGITGVAEEADLFGYKLAAGDYDGDGYDDLVVGMPYEDVDTFINAGAVNILYSTASGLGTTGQQLWNQGLNGLQETPEAYDIFGFGL